jgi:hypothetical protein
MYLKWCQSFILGLSFWGIDKRVTIDFLILFRRVSANTQQGGNVYGKEDESKGVFEGNGNDRCHSIHGPQYHFSRRTETDSASDASTWWWQSSNAVIVEKKVFKAIQPRTLVRRGSFKSPVGWLRDQSS